MSRDKPRPIGGFPEWLPWQRKVEQELIDRLRRRFETCGFVPIETRAVEPIDVLTNQGETDKEIYAIRRLHAAEGDTEALALHFDLTVPFARYTLEHKGRLTFPFKRYQIQKVWRGERAQAGRYREFYQADIDVIGDGELALSFDSEMPRLLLHALDALPIPPVTIRVNNRKLMEGFFRGLGIEHSTAALRIVDKLDKIGEDGVARALGEPLGLPSTPVERILALSRIRAGSAAELLAKVQPLVDGSEPPAWRDLFSQGTAELAQVLNELAGQRAVADLPIARGLDYYTGTVYEGTLAGHEDLGAVCSGGRYDDLASGGGAQKLPGIGMSIGLSRILGRLFERELVALSRTSPSCVLVAQVEPDSAPIAAAVVSALRARDIPSEAYHRTAKLGKQIEAASKRGIPFVWFVSHAGTPHRVKDLRSGEQVDGVDPATWEPPAADRYWRIV